jgi:hypothetical protein
LVLVGSVGRVFWHFGREAFFEHIN